MSKQNNSYISLRVPKKGPFWNVENPHITLAFFRDISPEEIADALPTDLEQGSITLHTTGAGIWRGQQGGRDPYWIVYASVDQVQTGQYLRSLRAFVLSELDLHTILPDRTFDFTPHITVWIGEGLKNAHERMPLNSGEPFRFTVDTLYISRPGRSDEALTVQL